MKLIINNHKYEVVLLNGKRVSLRYLFKPSHGAIIGYYTNQSKCQVLLMPKFFFFGKSSGLINPNFKRRGQT